MNELERGFIQQSIADLHNISRQIKENHFAILTDSFLNETFRTLHTIKGTAQTFGFSDAGNLAHSLENMVSGSKNNALFLADFADILREGILLLIGSFEPDNFQVSYSFADKIKQFQTNSKPHDFAENLLDEFPASITASLSASEKLTLSSALKHGKNLFVLEIGFSPASFAAEFKEFRADLSKTGEIIAALPSSKFAKLKQIGFQIVFASKENVKAFADKHSAEITFELHGNFANSLQGVLTKIIGHGKNTAKKLGKNVEFVIPADDFEPDVKLLKLIFDTLLHLVRNAVSHAIDVKGRVEIDVKSEENNFVLSVSDNGKGLDTAKIKAKAIEKNLISNTADLSEAEILELIFLPEFSTAETLTEISGRGIGLDVVKNLTEKAGGKISVKTESNKGTTFKIFLPKTF